MMFFSSYICAQPEIKMSVSKYNKEKEAILNVIINSIQFDSINNLYYSQSSNFVFAENEELYKGIPITLLYHGKKVEIIDCTKTETDCCWLGDLYLNVYCEEPKTARVQIELVCKTKQDILLGITLEKHTKWEITSFVRID